MLGKKGKERWVKQGKASEAVKGSEARKGEWGNARWVREGEWGKAWRGKTRQDKMSNAGSMRQWRTVRQGKVSEVRQDQWCKWVRQGQVSEQFKGWGKVRWVQLVQGTCMLEAIPVWRPKKYEKTSWCRIVERCFKTKNSPWAIKQRFLQPAIHEMVQQSSHKVGRGKWSTRWKTLLRCYLELKSKVKFSVASGNNNPSVWLRVICGARLENDVTIVFQCSNKPEVLKNNQQPINSSFHL